MRVGKEVQRQVLAEDLKRRRTQVVELSEDERKRLYDSLMTLPKEKRVPALRSAGLDTEADALEQKMAEEHIEELRQEKLAQINTMPVEDRMVELINNGFTEEAKALSEQLAAELAAGKAAEEEVETTEEQSEPEPEPDVKGDDVKPEPPKKKGGRPKKQKK